MKNSHVGSTLERFLKEEGIYEEAADHAVKRVFGWQIEQLQNAIDVGLKSGISSRSKEDIRRLGLQKLADAIKR